MKNFLLIVITGMTQVACGSDGHLFLIPTNKIIKIKQNIIAYETARATGYFSISSNEAFEAKQKLSAYAKGKLDLAHLVDDSTDEDERRLIGYYLLHTNDISVTSKLPISYVFLGLCVFDEAEKLAKEYVSVYAHDAVGWRVLGMAYVQKELLGLDSTNEIIFAFSNAVKLGDKDSLGPLVLCALTCNRMDVLKKIVPKLMALEQSKNAKKENVVEEASLLIVYAIKADRKDIFVKALKNANLEELLQDANVRTNIEISCKLFKGKDIDAISRRIQEVESKKRLK